MGIGMVSRVGPVISPGIGLVPVSSMAVRGTMDNRLGADGLGRGPGRPGQKKDDVED
jgi:hypothetical protein